MSQPLWQSILLSEPNQDAVWELFHENSKNRRYQSALSEQAIINEMTRLHESLPFEGYPVIDLPNATRSLNVSLEKAITTRTSALSMIATPISFEDVALLLTCAYGITRDTGSTGVRPFRAVPSAGALYPLEIFIYCKAVPQLVRALYHYNPSRNNLRLIREDVDEETIKDGFIQANLVSNISLLIFITAMFERSVFKYGERGYRYSLLEAGHVAQNICVVTNALNLSCLPLGGFIDDRIDDLLGLDGLRQSTVYAIAVGGKRE
jgi:SagB-type dehydrogenase family enzyme